MVNDRSKIYAQGSRLFQLVIYGLITVVLLLLLVNYPANLPPWRFFGTVITLVLLLVLNIIWAYPNPAASERQRLVQDWAFLTLSSISIIATVLLSGDFNIAYLQTIVCIQADSKRGVWPGGVVFSAVILVVWLGLQIVMGATFTAIVAVETSLATGFILGLLLITLLERYAHQTQRAEALLKELQAANTALSAAQQKEKDLAIAEERVRVARDIHDGLGHHLTVLSIQLQAAAKLVDRNPQAAGEAIQVCRTETQAALEEVRHSVGMLRQPPVENQPLQETLDGLVRSFDQHAGIHTSFEITGTPVEMSSFTRESLYRTAQEGLTNAQKHGKNVQQVSVRLSYELNSVRLCVEDDGQGPIEEAQSNPTGFGLKGLHERAVQLGGTFHSGTGKMGGYMIEICVPLQGNENDPGSSG